ncbi:MAG: tRNA pseudouridine(13) synthase TruD [Planctomycetota bacterium]
MSGPDPMTPGVVPGRYVTEDVPGIGGAIKQRPEDFIVDEQPAFPPSGEGEHIFLYVEKTGLSTFELIDRVAKHFRVHRSRVGYAGLKDKPAITRQTLSVHVPGKRPEDFPQLETDQIKVQWVDLHSSKLRRGQLAGNRFSIRIRDVGIQDALPAKRVLERLAITGVPNRLGEQRFGMVQNNHLIGRALILGRPHEALDLLLGTDPEMDDDGHADARALYRSQEYDAAIDALPRGMRTERRALKLLADGMAPDEVIDAMDPEVLSFYLSGFQSAIFNAMLDERIESDRLDKLMVGDLAFVHRGRKTFIVTEEELRDSDALERLDRFELCASGPMWGPDMRRTQGEIARLENDALHATGVIEADLERIGALTSLTGSRRPYRVPVIAPEVEGGIDEYGAYVRVAFELPRGSFATVVLREIMKPERARELRGSETA